MVEELEPRQRAAIRVAREIGDLLAMDHPEIADDYRNGLTHEQIALRYGLDEITDSHRIRRQAVLFALKKLIPADERQRLKAAKMKANGDRAVTLGTGIHGLLDSERVIFGRKAAQVLADRGLGIFALTPEQQKAHGQKMHRLGKGVHALTTEERRAIGKKNHQYKKGVHGLSSAEHREHGKKSHQMGVGIHAMTDEQRSELAKKTIAEGKGFGSLTPEQLQAQGEKSRDDKKGIFSKTAAELSEYGKKSATLKKGIHGYSKEERQESARLALLARGETPWTREEDLFCIQLIEDSNYQYHRGSRLCYDWQKIAAALNNQFHHKQPVRTAGAVTLFKYQRMKLYKP